MTRPSSLRLRLESPSTQAGAIREIAAAVCAAGSIRQAAPLLGVSGFHLQSLVSEFADLHAALAKLPRRKGGPIAKGGE